VPKPIAPNMSVGNVIELWDASNDELKLSEFDGVNVSKIVAPDDNVMSHEMISLPVKFPIDPSVVIVPVTVNPFWTVG
jgi:hypothetical protein